MTVIDCPECNGTGTNRSPGTRSGLQDHDARTVSCWICRGAKRIIQPRPGEQNWASLRYPECVATHAAEAS